MFRTWPIVLLRIGLDSARWHFFHQIGPEGFLFLQRRGAYDATGLALVHTNAGRQWALLSGEGDGV